MRTSIFVLLVLAVACSKPGIKNQEYPAARVMFVTGQAQIVGADKNLAVGDYIKEGDRLKTGPAATLEIFVRGQGIFRMAEQSELLVAQAQENVKTRIDLKTGSTAVFLKKLERQGEFVVSTPTALAGVRGTTFLVSIEEKATRVALYDGAIRLENNAGKDLIMDQSGEIVIRDGEDLTRNAIRPLSPGALAILKRLAVFQKNNINEYNSLLDELKKSDALKGIEVRESVAGKFAELSDRPEQAESARSADQNTIKHDTSQDPLKIKPNQTF
ncbi:MAG: FecR domain-containing protein [Leptospirales bacterium]|nr:FecR domain-containing protein [Leptospirales bacterium]